jgi:NAD-dependent dihydropyrimidine dehydrogenase PreA subunit
MTQFVYLKDVVTLELDRDKCTGCRVCESVCPHGVLVREGKKAHIAQLDACMECGACARNCRAEALTVRAGVGCAAGVINGALNRDTACC